MSADNPVTSDTPTREPMDEFEEHKALADVLLAHQPHANLLGDTFCACGMTFKAVDARAWHRHAASMVMNYLAALPPVPVAPEGAVAWQLMACPKCGGARKNRDWFCKHQFHFEKEVAAHPLPSDAPRLIGVVELDPATQTTKYTRADAASPPQDTPSAAMIANHFDAEYPTHNEATQ